MIEGGTVNASSWLGAGIGNGVGYARSNPAITTGIEIHGGMITAYSEQGACIGSGKDSSSRVLIDGGTICLDNKTQGVGTLLILERGRRVLHGHQPM